ncbi:unnamed protein product [Sphagnum jensenii]|uniref:Peptidase M20 dimerisation domain-containing protein n=1 Tax=Sphagnum jensenii TaxID=128206 RepID=A0ABP1AGD0_9BRYO
MTRKCSPRMSIGLLVIVMMAMAVIAVEDAKICKVPKGEEEMEGICNGIDVAMTEETLFVDGHRLQQQIDELSSFSDTPPPSVTRILFTGNDVAARRYVKGAMKEVGLLVREDAIGNIFGRWEGSIPGIPGVASGSHTDAIPYAGKYDGVVGVLGAIAAVRALKRIGFQPKRSIEVIMFTSEEPTRFGFGCLGSRMMANSTNIVEILKESFDAENVSFAEAAKEAGYLDVVMDHSGIPIGIVTAIAAPASLKVGFKGDGGHAGAVLMPVRNDAGLAGAELALSVEKNVLASGSTDTVGTTGVFKIHPGAVNSIPRESHLEIDIRDIDEKRRDKVVDEIKRSAHEIAGRRRVTLTNFEIVNQDPPAQSGDQVVGAAIEAAELLGLEYQTMVSRAYHDSLFMARIAPMGMIFIPCYKGYSHRPDEFASLEDMTKGVQVLSLTLKRLSSL